MKRPFPLQFLLLIFVPLSVTIILIALWSLNAYQVSVRRTVIQRDQHTAQLAAQLLEENATQLRPMSVPEQQQFIEEKLLTHLLPDDELAVLIVDKSENIVFASDVQHHPPGLQDHPGIAEALAGHGGLTEEMFDDGLHVITFVPVPSLEWALVIEETWSGFLDFRQNALLLIPLLFIPIILVALFYLWATNQWVLKPLQTVGQMAQAIGRGDFDSTMEPVRGVSELVNLKQDLQRTAEKLKEAQQSLLDYAQAIQQGQEEERQRVSQELHDDTIQSLVHLDQQVQLIQARAANLPQNGRSPHTLTLPADLDNIRRETARISQNIRRIIQDLHPTYLDELGLVPALKIYIDEMRARYPQRFESEVNGRVYRTDAPTELALYRIVQESVSNAIKHAEATRITIKLTYAPDEITLTIQDDGMGFEMNSGASRHGYGLVTMQQRARAIHAHFTLESNQQGSCIYIRKTSKNHNDSFKSAQ